MFRETQRERLRVIFDCKPESIGAPERMPGRQAQLDFFVRMYILGVYTLGGCHG